MKLGMLLVLLNVPLLAAASGGSWTSRSGGGAISYGNIIVKSQIIQSPAPLPATAKGARIAWRITPDSTPKPGLNIKLCSQNSCMVLPSLAGERAMPSSFPASGPFYFEYVTQVRGPVFPVLTILRNQVTVNYWVVVLSGVP